MSVLNDWDVAVRITDLKEILKDAAKYTRLAEGEIREWDKLSTQALRELSGLEGLEGAEDEDS